MMSIIDQRSPEGADTSKALRAVTITSGFHFLDPLVSKENAALAWCDERPHWANTVNA
jgi:hypothetical protein